MALPKWQNINNTDFQDKSFTGQEGLYKKPL
jgi:hypothetical protein